MMTRDECECEYVLSWSLACLEVRLGLRHQLLALSLEGSRLVLVFFFHAGFVRRFLLGGQIVFEAVNNTTCSRP